MAADITNDSELAHALAQIVHDGQNGNLDKDKCKKAQAYLKAAPNQTVTVSVTAIVGN